MKRLLHPFVILPAIALVAVAVWWFALRDDTTTTATTAAAQPFPTAQVVDVTEGSMDQSVSAEGTVAAAETDDLSFTSSGTVTAVNVKAGDTVTAGQVLATLDSTELAAKVTSAESDVADAEAKLADDQDADASDAQIAADLAQIATANDALADAKEALDGASLVATFDGTVTTVDLTVGEELSSGGTGGTTLTGSQSGSGQSPAASSSSSGSSSPGGSSSSSTSSSGSSAQIQIVSSGRFEVTVNVDATDVASVQEGQTVNLTVSTSSSSNRNRTFGGGFPGGGFPGATGSTSGNSSSGNSGNSSSGNSSSRSSSGGTAQRSSGAATATGTVTSVSKVAETSSGVAGYAVVVDFEADAAKFFVGTTVTADIVIAQRTDVLQVPSRAVTTDDSGSTVQVSTDGTADSTESRTVEVGLTANGMTEITSGLKAGEQVVVSFGRPGGAG